MVNVNMVKMRRLAAMLVAAVALAFAPSAAAETSGGRIVRDIPYAPALGAAGSGDLHLPASRRFMETSIPLASGRDAPTARPQTPPVLLLIHGGGWGAGNRSGMECIAEFFTDDLGFAVFNIDYRLASVTNRWPACGDDCLAAANWLFSDEFSRIAGFSPSRIWLCGGSAGGHLALWTLVNLPPEKVAGCVSISSIGDPAPDFFLHRGRYTALFGKEVSYSSLDAMNPLLRVRPGMAPLLCTHAGGDGVVPVASHRAFAETYAAAGNRCDFFEYPCDAEPNTGNHCIWRKGRKRLLNIIEQRIARFVREVEAGTPHSAEDTLRAPELLFSAPFDGTAHAAFSKGRPEPIPGTRNLRFVAGRRGQAVERKRGIDSLLGYPAQGNLNPERGTVMFWFKPDAEAQSAGNHLESRKFLCTKVPTPRRGSGALMFWQWGWRLRADQSDDGDRYAISSRLPKADQWHHLAFTWGPEGHDIYLDGRRATQLRDSGSPLRAALSAKAMTFSNRVDFAEFIVGGSEAGEFMDGAMDDLEIWSAPLPPEAIAKRFHDDGGVERGPDIPDYGALFNQDGPNRFEGAPLAQGGLPGKMKLLSRLTLDSIPDDPDRFISSAPCSVGSLGGTRYLQAGDKANDRFAVRFEVPPQGAPCVIEIDYPDDALRTMDIIVQGAGTQTWERAEGADNMLQEGVACGDEYPNTGRILTHRCIYWPRTTDVAIVAMTARAGAPAAISEIRVYAIEGGALPAAAIHEPPANDDGWHRTFALYYEDPAIHFDFDVGGTRADTFGAFADRAAALMHYTGQNLLCYPGSWYCGVIGEDYMPRVHAPGYRTAWYEKFDREGLGFMPTINQNNIRVPSGAVTREMIENGSLNMSPISIWDDGKPNPGGWHGTPPNFNIAHHDVQREIERAVDLFIEEGRDHPSFKGVALHLTKHCLCWFGDERSGYNEYAIRAFCRERGISPPGSPDGRSLTGQRGSGVAETPSFTAPLRGKAYAEWLREDPVRWEAWLDWRCDVVARLYRRLAEKLRAARPDLKLVVNSFLVPDFKHPDFGKENFVAEANRRAGLDPRKLADVPNLSICQTEVPADYRFRGPPPGHWKEFAETAAPIERDLWSRRGSYALLDGARFPWVNQHDRYWESRIGGVTAKPGPGSLACPWLKECGWRVTTINPSGRHALKHYAAPFRFHDLQALSKGGYLIGTYGTEEVLVPFIQAFRALPAVVFDDLPGLDPESPVRVCAKAFRGKAYFYAINTGDAPAEVRLAIPAGTTDLVGGEAVEGDRAATVTLKLEPYELRSFSAPEAGLRDLAIFGVSRATATEPQEVQAPEAPMPRIEGLSWRLPPKFATLEGDRLVIDIPADAYPADAVAEAELPPALFKGATGFSVSVKAEGAAIAPPEKRWLGLKFQFHIRKESTGRDWWPNCAREPGDFGPKTLRNDIAFGGMGPDGTETVTLQLGLQGTSGRVVFDLSTLCGAPSEGLFRRINQDWVVRYPNNASQRRRPLRGAMLPGRPTTEDDIATLAAWGATLARFQMTRKWTAEDGDDGLDEYNRWLDSRLDNLEEVLRWARAHGMKITVDLHAPPGGRAASGETAMVRDARYAEAFVETWRRIVARLKGNADVIYGYDLVNEPVQSGRAPFDYWTLQRRAAEAIREIDPDTAIIVESNSWDAPNTFAYLSPLRMDNVIYQVHVYAPMEFTHQGVGTSPVGPKWPDPEKKWTKDYLRDLLAPVREFERRHGARIYVGEFSASIWADGADNYLRDCIDLFAEYGWDWTYHAFRESPVWDVDKECLDDGSIVPAKTDTPRKRVLIEGLKK